MASTARRWCQLMSGLWLYGVSIALLVRSSLGVMPWDVLHQGLARHLGVALGSAVVATSGFALLAWIPTRQRPGVGTFANSVLVGVAVDATLSMLAKPDIVVTQTGFAVAGILLNALATAAYIGAGLGPGPRDGLMTGIVRRTGQPVRLVRTTIEVVLFIIGWLLGGRLGIATIAYAVAVGPLIHQLLPRLTVREPASSAAAGLLRQPIPAVTQAIE